MVFKHTPLIKEIWIAETKCTGKWSLTLTACGQRCLLITFLQMFIIGDIEILKYTPEINSINLSTSCSGQNIILFSLWTF